MQINNQLETQSFSFSTDKPNMLSRSEEIRNLLEIDVYCKSIDEAINYTEDIWDIEVEEGVTFVEWLYSSRGQEGEDERRGLIELVGKVKTTSGQKTQQISVSLGPYNLAAFDLQSYIKARRDILQKLSNPSEFGAFMPSCFINSVFADDIVHEMKNIDNFSNHTVEIVDNLSVLNDEAISLYEEHHNNLKVAMDILSSKLLECSPDPNHVDVLKFTFSYEESINGGNVAKCKEITCSPHLKLVNRGSNLRIYFWWCDNEVGNGEKVLIGRIGRHPY